MFKTRMHPMAVGVLLAVASASVAAQSPVAQRGRQLYETNCTMCHQQSVHSRPAREARSMSDIRSYARKWSAAAGLRWTNEEIDEVSVYLNERFYRFVSPYERG